MKMEFVFKLAQIIRLEMKKPIDAKTPEAIYYLKSYHAAKRIIRLLRRRKLLNEGTVERSELLRFCAFTRKNDEIDWANLTDESIVEDYLQNLSNSAKRN